MKNIAGNPYLKKERGKVLIDLISLENILSRYKTPLLVFLENRVRDNIRSFIEVIGSEFNDFECFYSFKANFLPDICNIICSEKIGANVVGVPELRLALKLGFPPNKIIAGGPFLPKEMLKLSIKNQIKEIIVYNLNDIKRIDLIAQKYNINQNICIRINSQKYNSKLGINFDKKNLMLLKSLIASCKNIKVTTILSHYSTQMNNVDLFEKNAEIVARSFKILFKNGIDIKNVNLGGGFPEATVMNQNQIKNLSIRIKSIFKEHNINFEHVFFEPGRYFVGDAGLFITKIIKIYNENHIFLNIGNQICPKFAKCSLRFYNASKIDLSHNKPTTFLGIVPTEQDILAKDYFFTENLKEGDKVIVTNTGAYCLTFSNRFPYPLPKIFLIKDNQLKQIFDPNSEKDFSLH